MPMLTNSKITSIIMGLLDSILGKKEMSEAQCFDISDLVQISCGAGFVLCPYDYGWLIEAPDAKIFNMLANTDKIKKYLPGLDFSTEEKANKTLLSLLVRTEAQMGFTYIIRQNNIPIGLINVDTPLYNKSFLGIKIWTIDFFILPEFEHQHIMFNTLLRLLDLLKTRIGVEKIHALVDPQNSECLNLISNGLFVEINNSGFVNKVSKGNIPRVFEMDLTKVKFQSRT